MTNELSQRIEACIAVELLAAEIYLIMAACFPDERDFFMDLCEEEQEHADILKLAMGFQRIEKVPDYIVPDSFLNIYETFKLARYLKNTLENREVSLKEALAMALELEDSFAEKHFQDVFSHTESDSYIINKLNSLQSDSRRHSDRINDLMKSKNLLD